MRKGNYGRGQKNTVICIAISLIYLSITYVWNLVSFDMIDIVFLLIMAHSILFVLTKPIKVIKGIRGEVVVLICFSFFALYQLIYALLNVNQSLFETLLTIRELLYFFVAFFFAFYCKFSTKYVKTMVKLELIGCVLYIITFFLGSPISPFFHFKASSVLVGTVRVYRDFTPIPLLVMFVVPYLFTGLIRKTYLWDRKKDTYVLGILLIILGMHLFRARIIVSIMGVVLVILISEEKGKRRRHAKRIMQMIGVVAILIALMVTIPVFRNRLIEGLTDVLYVFSGQELNPYGGTFTYRMWLLNNRIEYLSENNKLFLGMGAISSRNRTSFFGSGSLGALYNPDNAYLTLLPRYGIIGTMFYIGVLIYFAVKGIKNNTQFSIAMSIYIISEIIEGTAGNSALCEYALILFGMLVGLGISEQIQLNEDENAIKERKREYKKVWKNRNQ